MNTRPARFTLSHGPQVVVIKKTLGAEDPERQITKNDRGQIVVSIKSDAAGFVPFWGENSEILRILPSTGNAVVKVKDSEDQDVDLKTVSAGEPFIGSLFLNGKESVLMEFTGELQLLVRAVERPM